ncbi:hypothetical protein QZJ86_13870 [Methylomonas montana]|uniref:hypothetical protein n=1 Tax=Methylomonas montana TaxID=3058963 RepID=UPI002659AEEF|nr:hypothetical protein [Methylomonas montana]WKJ89106.1 hypothetical protein QZJ86_13870 [Methylomonas montana]
MTKLNREDASKKGADFYLKNQDKCSKIFSEPDKLEYYKIAKNVIGEGDDKDNSLNKLIMFIGGYKWEAFKFYDLDEHAQSALKTILDDQKEQ